MHNTRMYLFSILENHARFGSSARNWVNVPATNWSSSCSISASMRELPGRLRLNKWCSRKESKVVARMRTVQVFDSVFSNPLPRQLLASGSFTKHALCLARTRGGKFVALGCLIQQNTISKICVFHDLSTIASRWTAYSFYDCSCVRFKAKIT